MYKVFKLIVGAVGLVVIGAVLLVGLNSIFNEKDAKSVANTEIAPLPKQERAQLEVADTIKDPQLAATVMGLYAHNLADAAWQKVAETTEAQAEITLAVGINAAGEAKYQFLRDAETVNSATPWYRLVGTNLEEVAYFAPNDREVKRAHLAEIVAYVNARYSDEQLARLKTAVTVTQAAPTKTKATPAPAPAERTDGHWAYGQTFGERPEFRHYVGKVALGFGRDQQGKRDAVVNQAARDYNLGKFISEEHYMPNGIGGIVAVKWNVAKINCENGYMYVTTSQQLQEVIDDEDGQFAGIRDLETPVVHSKLEAVYLY